MTLDRLFDLRARGTTVRIEVLAGATTFLTMAYIVFVQPAVLAAAGMDAGAVMTATCISSAVATLLMAFLANYPIGIAPAMGHNFYFAFSVVIIMKTPWPIALGAVAIAGLLFIATAGIGLRERLITAIPGSLVHAIGAGIGLLIALIGLEWCGMIVPTPGTFVTLGSLKAPPTLLALFTLAVMAVLMARGWKGAMLVGMLISTAVGLATGLVHFDGHIVSLPPSLAPTFFKFDILGALTPAHVDIIIVFFFLALFDSVGTLVGVANRAGLMTDGTLPRAREALLADAAGTVVGAALGTSTVTAYIESATGVAAGGRTGLTAVVIALLFLLSMFFSPLVHIIGGGYASNGPTLYPIVAPALILVGAMMMEAAGRIEWKDPTESIPAFLAIAIMPLAVSITDGIAFGFISCALLKLATGRGRELHWLVYVFAALFVLRYAFALR